MGLKGISWIEQNVEKVVVGVFGVGLLGVVALQFVGDGNNVEVKGAAGKRSSYGYDLVWDQVAQQARTTKSAITTIEPSGSEKPFDEDPGVLAAFTERLHGSVSPTASLAADLDRPTLEYIGAQNPLRKAKAETYAGLAAPSTAKPVGASYLATVHPQELVANADLAKMVGADVKALADGKFGAVLPKLDRAAVSVEATYDGTALETLLLADPDGEGPIAAMPRHWWDNGRVQILGVEMERQELKPDGQWESAPTKVVHMPGRLDLLKSVGEMNNGGDVRYTDILDMAQKEQEAVQRPAYYSVVFGEDWVPPSEVPVIDTTAAVGGDRVTRLKKQLADKDASLARRQQEIDRLEQEIGQGGNQPARPQAPTGGGKGGASQPAQPPRDGAQGPRDPKQTRLDAQRRAYAKEYAEREKIVDSLLDLGVDVDGESKVAEPAAPKPATPDVPLLQNPEVRIWSHDVTVERGKTYRYRMSLVLNNPIYMKNAALDPKQADLAKEPLVRTAASEWSDPVSVDPETFYFITSASPEDSFASAARASAEVFVFSMGYWRKGQVNLEPGDTIAADIRVPDPEKVVAMINVDPNAQPIMPAPAPEVRPGGPRGVPGQRPIPTPNNPAPAPNLPNPGEPAAIDPATIMVPKTVAEDALLLDVATTTVVSEQGIAKTKTENQAFLLNETGVIVVRTPDGDRSRWEYQKVVASAAKGEDALRARPAKPLAPTGVMPGPGPSPTPRDTEGSGGGG